MCGNIKLSSFIERTKGGFPSTKIIIGRLFLRKNRKIGLNIFCEIVNILNLTISLKDKYLCSLKENENSIFW